MNNEKISPLAAGILQGLKEAIADTNGEPVNDTKKSFVYRVQPQAIRQQLKMSQSQFARAFGIPLSTLQGWEQGRRKIDMTTASYLRTISKFPNEVQFALVNDNK